MPPMDSTSRSDRLEESFQRDTDIIQPFQLEATNLRGRLVRMDDVLDDILGRHDYPILVADLLAEALTVTVILASALKYKGIFTLQTRSDGPISMVIIDMTSDGGIRGYAKFDQEKLNQIETDLGDVSGLSRPSHKAGLSTIMGGGYLAFTVDQGDHSERYQGIVELAGSNMADCVVNYFKQSEQLDTGVSIKVEQQHGRWRAGGLMLQRMPEDQAQIINKRLGNDEEDGWRRAMVMLGSLTTDEMLDPALPANDLLYRLFNEDGVRVFERHPVSRDCRCNRDRILSMLQGLPADAIEDMAVDNALEVTCEFCSTVYQVSLPDILKNREEE
jgi:molecular chaperone Hsp33